MDARIDALVAAVDPVLRSTLAALGRGPALRNVLAAYAQAGPDGPAFEQLGRAARPILADAGAGKRAAAELLDKWRAITSQPLGPSAAPNPAVAAPAPPNSPSPADAASHNECVDMLMALVDGTLLSTLRVLRTEPLLRHVVTTYIQAHDSDPAAFTTLSNKARPILADAGSGKRATNDLLYAWKTAVARPPPGTVEGAPAASQGTASACPAAHAKRPTSPPRVQTNTKSPKPLPVPDALPTSSPAAAALPAAVDLDLSGLVDVLPGAGSGPKIVATSQVSRFALDAADTASLELDLKDVNLTIEGQEILSSAHLRLKAGVHYAMYGRNGTGKSTLLKAIAERLIPAVPRTLRILLVSQVQHDLLVSAPQHAKAGLDAAPLSTLAAVLMADYERVRLETASASLSAALDGTDERVVAYAQAQYEVQEARHHLAEAQRHVLQRTGTRGSEARKELNVAEAALDAAVAQVASLDPANASAALDEQVAKRAWRADAAETYTRLITVLEENFDVATAEARAAQILHGLGFTQQQITGPYVNLSGGWKARAALASALLKPSDVILLDEPTNYLDLPAVLWLERFLSEAVATVVVVSHDRAFVDTVAEEVVILRHKKLTYFEGNLTAYEMDLARRHLASNRQRAALDKKKEALTKSITEGYKRAKASGDDKRMKQIKMKQHKLDDRWGVERSSKGTRFKLNRDLAGYHLTTRGDIEVDAADDEITFSFPSPAELRFPGAMVHIDHATFTYPETQAAALTDVSLTVGEGDRIALVGQNGHGKSTLVKLVTGEVSPDKGRVERHARARIAVYDQDTIEALSRLPGGKGAPTAISWLADHLRADASAPDGKDLTGQLRSALARFGLRGRTVDTQALNSLSGGQKVRVGLAAVTWYGPHLLVLDEATQHLDADSVRALGDALCAFPGAVLLVSHDRAAVKRLMQPEVALADRLGENAADDDLYLRHALDEARRALASVDDGTASDEVASDPQYRRGRVYSVHQGKIRFLPGGVDAYVRQVEKSLS